MVFTTTKKKKKKKTQAMLAASGSEKCSIRLSVCCRGSGRQVKAPHTSCIYTRRLGEVKNFISIQITSLERLYGGFQCIALWS